MWAWSPKGAERRVLAHVDGPDLRSEAVERLLDPADLKSRALGVIRPVL